MNGDMPIHTLLAKQGAAFRVVEVFHFHRRDRGDHQRDAAQRLHGGACGERWRRGFIIWGKGLELIRGISFARRVSPNSSLPSTRRWKRGIAVGPANDRPVLRAAANDITARRRACSRWIRPIASSGAYIPHFYYGFYVYQNATSMAGAAAVRRRAKKGRRARDKRVTSPC